MVDTSLVLNAIVAVSIAAGAVFAIVELREAGRSRRTHTVFEMIKHMTSPSMGLQWDRIMKAEFRNAKEAEEKCSWEALHNMASFFEGVGLMVRRRLVDEDLVFEILLVAPLWDHMKPWSSEVRARLGPDVYKHFEHLAELNRLYSAKKKTSA